MLFLHKKNLRLSPYCSEYSSMTLFTIILYYTIVRILIHLSKLILQHTSIHESFPNIRRTKGQQ